MQKLIIDKIICTGCTICVEECPTNALEMENDVAILVRPEDCNSCGICEEACPLSAITTE